MATHTGRELIGDEALEPLELGLLLGRGDGAAVGRLRVQPAEAPVAALHHRQHVALLDVGVHLAQDVVLAAGLDEHREAVEAHLAGAALLLRVVAPDRTGASGK